MMQTAVIIVAAGRGIRAGGDGPPKQYWPIAGRPALEHALEVFSSHPAIGEMVTVIHGDDRQLYDRASAAFKDRLSAPVIGGATRQASVRAGLEALGGASPDTVLIHDAVRPFVTADIIDRVLGALESADGALPAVSLADTLKRTADGHVVETLKRENLWRAQTPQGFRYDKICRAHQAANSKGEADFTDDAQVAEWHGLDVVVVQGAAANIKLTTPEDFSVAERLLSDGGAGGEWRTGHGSDVHRLEPGDHVMLCGVRIRHDQTLAGHSDADVGLHAVTDAVLGAIGDGDIGVHFPPSDPKWRDAASDLFLRDAADRVVSRGGRIVNVDVTLICEAPRIGPHRDAMRRRIAEILDLALDRVSVKATTTEGLGYAGRSEGIAAQASVSVWLP